MKKLILALSILPSLTMAEDLNTDVKVGVEAYIIGNLALSKYLLENSLTAFRKDDKRSEFNRSRVLNTLNEQAAIDHLFPIYFELREFDKLEGHLKRYGSNKRSSAIAEYRSVRRGDLWTCRTLDYQEKFIKASECWDKAGYEYERNISTRAATVKRVFGGAKKVPAQFQP